MGAGESGDEVGMCWMKVPYAVCRGTLPPFPDAGLPPQWDNRSVGPEEAQSCLCKEDWLAGMRSRASAPTIWFRDPF